MNEGEVISNHPIAVPAEAGLADTVRLMLDQHVSGLPVIGGKVGLVGILTEGDLLRRCDRYGRAALGLAQPADDPRPPLSWWGSAAAKP